jgi:diguanylate cyclase (GGDEF)-like protein
MSELEHAMETQRAHISSVALFNEHGVLQGGTAAFAGADCSGRMITDFLPELPAARWAEIWRRVQSGEVESFCFAQSNVGNDPMQPVEVEVCKFLGPNDPLAKVEVSRADDAGGRLRTLQQEILEAMASGVPVKAIMDFLCHRAEALAPTAICSVLAIDQNRLLRHIASPSLPEHYSRAIDGLAIGAKTGSCGTAAYLGEPVEVTDIASDPLWEDYKCLALPLGLRACWPSPIKSSSGRVLGAFAFYFPVPRGPNLLERQIVTTCLNLCAIALDHEETRSRMYELAFHDQITRLANRARFQQRVSEALRVIVETGQRLAIHYIGVDHFKTINDALGYAAGDDLLKSVAARLQGVVRDADAVARIGGDEFALIQVGDLQAQDIANRAEQIMELVAEPHDVAGQRLAINASIGIALAPDDGNNAEELIKNAALALHRVKELGRGAYFFYEKELNARMQARRKLEADMRDAISAGEFELYFQPIFNIARREITGAEGLLRWHHRERGMVLPREFIPVAEDSGLIVPLGTWVLRQACLAAQRWPSHMSVSVNLSSIQFERTGLVQAIAAALAESRLQPSRLEIEITESVLLRDSEVNLAIVDQLIELGVSIALDDFDTGYSSLAYLQRFSFDRIKIDRSFIKDIEFNEGSFKIVRGIVGLAHSLGLAVTAEGVETEAQFAVVRGEGCDDVQGYYIGRAKPLKSVEERLGPPGLARAAGGER